MSFDACEVDGVVMDGDITYAQQLESRGTAESLDIDYHWSYEGVVDFSGAVEGSCEVDLSASLTGDGSDDLELDLANRTYAGTMCGFDGATVAADADL